MAKVKKPKPKPKPEPVIVGGQDIISIPIQKRKPKKRKKQ
jgi:hypothetical protein